MSDAPTPAAARPAALVFILVTVLIDVLAFGIIIPVLPKLVEEFLGGDTPRAAEIYGLFGIAWALMQFLFAPVLGALSDRYGRRPVILLSCLGLGLDYVLMALAPSLLWLFVGRVISGITAASFTTAGAYIADVTPPEKRAGAFGMIGAAWGVGFVLGPALGGLLGHFDPRWPFWGAAGLALLNFLYGWLVLPESLPASRRDRLQWGKANPFGALKLLRSHRELFGLAGVNVLFYLAHHSLPSVFVLYTSYRYGWSIATTGSALALVGVCSVIVQAGLVKPAVNWLGERGALLLGSAAGVVGFAGFALSPTALGMWLSIPVFELMGLTQPAMQALMTRHVGESEQGQLQGANGAIMGLTGIVGPGLFAYTFAWFIRPEASPPVPGAPFLLAAALMLAAALLAARVTRRPA